MQVGLGGKEHVLASDEVPVMAGRAHGAGTRDQEAVRFLGARECGPVVTENEHGGRSRRPLPARFRPE